MIFPGFVGPSYTSQSPNADAELCMNWYPEQLESPGAKVPWALYPCPGFTAFASVVQAPVRGIFATGGLVNRFFAVIAFKLYEFDADGTAHDRGDVVLDDHPATFATNGATGNQMMVTSGGVLYVYDLNADTLTAITVFSGASPTPIPIRQVAYLTNRFIALDDTASAYYWSDISDGSSWSLGQKTARSTAPDPWISMRVVLGQLWLLGSLTSDIYAPTADPDNPYQPAIQGGAYVEQGCSAPFSLVNVDSTLVWLGRNQDGDGIVWRSNGYQPVRISNHAVEFAIQGYDTTSDAVGFAYQDQGHWFYVLNFPTEEATWVYDTATGVWHQRGYWKSRTSEFLAYRPQYHAFFNNQHLVGDRLTGTIYVMDISLSTDVDGAKIRRVRQTPHAWDGAMGNYVYYPGLQIDLQTGVGVSALAGDPPTLELSWSDDGGRTYTILRAASVGNLGEYTLRVIFNRLGRSRDRVFRLVCAGAVPYRILQAIFRPDPVVGTN